ncbi:uncharacterized protein LOC122210600 [Panthera leo]|uniref:uncharacterized protein LOC122210600 n=1 Tax=Panthera leo TaxID=9689 RepID=UPI001C694714|nr:uncharacterized protein LOC122210600 [Panthera leo]
MSGAGIERAERELGEATGSARARALCARAARGSSEPPPGGRGGGGAGASLRHCPPIPTWGWEGGLLPFPGQPSSSSRTSCPPTFLFAPPPGFSPLRPTATLGYCFRVGVTSGVKELRLGAGPGRAALTTPRSRVEGTPAGRRRGSPRVSEWAPPGPSCPSSAGLAPSQIFPKSKSQPTPAPTSSDLERFSERRLHGVGLCNLKMLLFFSSVQWSCDIP